MITITANISEFITRYSKKINGFKLAMQNLAYELAKKMSEDMQSLILTDRRWQEHGNLSEINNVTFRPEILSPNTVRVHIGENLPLIEMGDGNLVNPAFFIEFGFGIVGEKTPKENSEKVGWDYNINHHQESWFFKYRGELMESEGREGINFIYVTMQKYVLEWKEFFRLLLMRYVNV